MSGAPQFTIHTSIGSGAVRAVTVGGEVDLLTSPELAAALREAARGRPATLIVDLSAVELLDSSGLHVLLNAQRRAEAAGGRMIIASPSWPVLEVLRLSGAADGLTIAVERPGAAMA